MFQIAFNIFYLFPVNARRRVIIFLITLVQSRNMPHLIAFFFFTADSSAHEHKSNTILRSIRPKVELSVLVFSILVQFVEDNEASFNAPHSGLSVKDAGANGR